MKFVFLICLMLCGCSFGVEHSKRHAKEAWASQGMSIVGYQGYSLNILGGCAWYLLKKNPDNGILYEGCLLRWFDETHVYSLTAKDAIKP